MWVCAREAEREILRRVRTGLNSNNALIYRSSEPSVAVRRRCGEAHVLVSEQCNWNGRLVAETSNVGTSLKIFKEERGRKG